jgi:hypothetical protein
MSRRKRSKLSRSGRDEDADAGTSAEEEVVLQDDAAAAAAAAMSTNFAVIGLAPGAVRQDPQRMILPETLEEEEA